MERKGFLILFTGVGIGIIIGYLLAVIFLQNKTAKDTVKPDFGSTVENELDKFVEQKKEELAKNPSNIQTRIDLANMLFDLGKDKEAAEQYGLVLGKQPDNLNILSDLGVCYRRMKEPKKAIEYFNKVVEKDPRHLVAWYNIAVTSFYDLKDLKTARNALDKAMKIDPFYENAIRLKTALDAAERK
jgi:tetratricopeptide (TPR) repeat protein